MRPLTALGPDQMISTEHVREIKLRIRPVLGHDVQVILSVAKPWVSMPLEHLAAVAFPVCDQPGETQLTAAALQTVAAGVAGLTPLEVDERRAMLLVARDGPGVSRALEGLYGGGLALDDVTIKEPNLEDLFLKLTGRELRD